MDAAEQGRLAHPIKRGGILAFVLAGGQGTRLQPLTATHPKPALPFAGRRIIDFVLSNLYNSGITSIYVLAQYKADVIARHMENGWCDELEIAGGFIRVVLPPSDRDVFLGTADAVYKNIDLIRRHAPEMVAVFAADHVYRMHVGQMARFHATARADVTIAALPLPLREARRCGAMAASPQGRVEKFEEKPLYPIPMPSRQTHAYASMGNYLFRPDALVELLVDTHSRGEGDFGAHLLPRALRSHKVFAYDFSGNRVPGLLDCEERCYWRDVGTLEAYWAAQEDALGSSPRFSVENPQWPILGAAASCFMPSREKASAVLHC